MFSFAGTYPFNTISTAVKNILKKETVFNHSLGVWVATGAERSGGEMLQLAYAGMEKHKNYFFETAFRPGYQEQTCGKVTPRAISDQIAQDFPECQAVFVEVDPSNKRKSFASLKNAAFKIPVWVQWELDIRGSMEELNRKPGIAHIQKQWKRSSFEYQITNDEDQFADFFHKIYAPFTQKKQGPDALICSFEEALEKFRLGELLLVKERGIVVGGVVLEYSLTRCIPNCIAVNPSREDLVRKGILSAIMYQVILRARGRSFDKVNLGITRPYIKDDVARFKTRLGAHPVIGFDQDGTYLMMKVMQWDTAFKAFLRANPFISIDDAGAFRTIIFAENESHQRLSELKTLCAEVCHAGSDFLDLYFFGKPIPVEAVTAKPEFSKIRVLSSAELAA